MRLPHGLDRAEAIYHLFDRRQGDIIKKAPPFVDGTTGKLKEFLELLQHYLIRLGIEEAYQVILVGDGAPWIWERIPNLLKKRAWIAV